MVTWAGWHELFLASNRGQDKASHDVLSIWPGGLAKNVLIYCDTNNLHMFSATGAQLDRSRSKPLQVGSRSFPL